MLIIGIIIGPHCKGHILEFPLNPMNLSKGETWLVGFIQTKKDMKHFLIMGQMFKLGGGGSFGRSSLLLNHCFSCG